MIFRCNYPTTLLFFAQKLCSIVIFVPVVPVVHRLHRLYRFCTKIEKNLTIFCNFFSLCINDLEEI